MDTRYKIVKIIKEHLGVEESEVKDGASLTDDLGADSLDAIEILMALEEEFGINIPDEDANKTKTVGDVINYIDGILENRSKIGERYFAE